MPLGPRRGKIDVEEDMEAEFEVRYKEVRYAEGGAV